MSEIVRAEIHCHSIGGKLPYFPWWYDAVQSVEEIVDKCIKLKLGVLSITDHDTLDGWRKAKKYIAENKLPITLISGCEISSKDGHILAYGIEKEIGKGMSAERTVAQIREQGGIAVAPHPFMIFALGKKIKSVDFDAIETSNALIPEKLNIKAREWAVRLNKSATGGSDAHRAADIGITTIEFRTKIKNFSEFKKAILERNFTVREGKINKREMVLDFCLKNSNLMLEGRTI